LTGAHPNIGVGLAGCKTHVAKCVGEPLMPTKSTTMQTVKGLLDGKDVTGEVSKLRSGNNKDFLLGFGFEVGISNVGSP